MGYPKSRFNQDVPSELVCGICCNVVEEPVVLSCSHAYCKPCAQKIEEGSGRCASCQADVKGCKHEALNPMVVNIWKGLKIKCQFEPKGCKVITTLGDESDHASQCSYHPEKGVICSQGCGFMGVLETHSCLSYLMEQLKIHKETSGKSNLQSLERELGDVRKVMNGKRDDMRKLREELKNLGLRAKSAQDQIRMTKEDMALNKAKKVTSETENQEDTEQLELELKNRLNRTRNDQKKLSYQLRILRKRRTSSLNGSKVSQSHDDSLIEGSDTVGKDQETSPSSRSPNDKTDKDGRERRDSVSNKVQSKRRGYRGNRRFRGRRSSDFPYPSRQSLGSVDYQKVVETYGNPMLI